MTTIIFFIVILFIFCVAMFNVQNRKIVKLNEDYIEVLEEHYKLDQDIENINKNASKSFDSIVEFQNGLANHIDYIYVLVKNLEDTLEDDEKYLMFESDFELPPSNDNDNNGGHLN